MFLTKEEFFNKAEEIGTDHWKYLDGRWFYHNQSLEIVKKLNITNPENVLEMGTVGMQLVHDSHTLDFDEHWDFPGKKPTYNHNGMITPWPIKDKQYDVFIALRVFQHLHLKQKEAFLEAKRIANHVILCVPIISNDFISKTNPEGISVEQFIEWNDGIKPDQIVETKSWGNIYYWNFLK